MQKHHYTSAGLAALTLSYGPLTWRRCCARGRVLVLATALRRAMRPTVSFVGALFHR
jgi:hypothetical protein